MRALKGLALLVVFFLIMIWLVREFPEQADAWADMILRSG